MKKTILFSACAALSLSMVACGGNPNKAKNAEAAAETKAEAKAAPVYNVIDKPQVDLATLPVDKEGYYVIFDGKTFNGWRGYGRTTFRPSGRSKTVRSNSTARAAAKRRRPTAAT